MPTIYLHNKFFNCTILYKLPYQLGYLYLVRYTTKKERENNTPIEEIKHVLVYNHQRKDIEEEILRNHEFIKYSLMDIYSFLYNHLEDLDETVYKQDEDIRKQYLNAIKHIRTILPSIQNRHTN